MADTASDPDSGDQYRRSLLRQERSRKTREDIVRSAARLWADQGFEDTTIAAICELAGVARTTYYFHFANKDALLGELTWLTAQGVQHRVEEALSADGGLDRTIEIFVTEISRRVTAMPQGLAAQVLQAAMPGVALLGHFPDDRVDFGRMLADIFRHAQQAGELDPHVDAAEVGAIVGGMIMEGMLRWSTGHTGNRTLNDVLHQRTELALDGLRTHPHE